MRRTRSLALLAPLALLVPAAAAAQAAGPVVNEHDARPVARAVRIATPIHIDGRLDDAAWAEAPVFDRFVQIDPLEGQPATQRTEARIVYDYDALYVGVRLHDTGEVRGRLGRRDMPLGDSDWLGVMIDSYHDHRTAFGFDVNPAGVRRDEIKVIETDDNSWDPVWDVATTVDEGGWTAEYRIPFSQLRFSSADVQTWGIQLERMIGRIREYSVSTFIPKSEQGGVPKYGHLEGLREIRPGKRLEVLPYTLAKGEYVDPGQNPYRGDAEHGISGGVDLKYRVTSNLTLDATLNPDFGQVEVDPAVINLGVYETQYDEKRPFFIEGGEIFDFGSGGGGQLFYTRRIGRAPQLGAPTLRSDVPSVTTILGAAKLSGRTAGGWSVGVMEALTQEEVALFRDPGGADLEAVAEPLTNYFVGRARRDLRSGASALGGIFTAVHRQLDPGAARDQLRASAYTGGLDFRHEWDNRGWRLSGAAALSHALGSREAITLTQRLSNHYFQRPDADHLEVDEDATSLTGLAASMTLARQAGEHWRGQVSVATTTPGYEVNDVGFNYRTDRRDVEGEITYVQNAPGSFWRNWQTTASARFEGNYAGQRIANWLTASAYFRHLEYWSTQLRLNHSLRSRDDRLTRGGPIALRPAASDYFVNFVSDVRRPVTLEVGSSGMLDEFDGWRWQAYADVGLKTSPRWNLSVGPSFTRERVTAQYVTTVADPAATATFGNRYVFAPLEYTELGVETRVNYTFQPGLSLEVFLQPLLSSGDYGAAAALAAPATYRFDPYAGEVPNLDFNVRSMRGNAVLRWEWRRGSTMYVAWQQSRYHEDQLADFDFARDRRHLFSARPDNIFLVKVNYWLNP